MKKQIIAGLILSLGIASFPAQAKGLIGSQRAASIAQKRVGGGKVDNIDLERSRRYGTYYEVDVENCKGEYEVRVSATSGKVLSVKRDGDGDNEYCHRGNKRSNYKNSDGGRHGDRFDDDDDNDEYE